MKLVERIAINHGEVVRHIELLQGDLTEMPPEHAVDVLVVSAFPDDYSPTSGSLIGSLAARGLSVRDLSTDKYADLREYFSCWLSKEISPTVPGLAFRHILCFEPQSRGSPPAVVGSIFQALAPFTFADPHIKSVALPIVAAGDQGYSVSAMLPPLMDAAIHWLHTGFPVDTIKLVVLREDELNEASSLFRQRALSSSAASTALAPKQGSASVGSRSNSSIVRNATEWKYDVFVSYSHEDKGAADIFVKALRDAHLRVFLDRLEIEVGSSWQQQIWSAMDECASITTLLSPAFLRSAMCKDEFAMANLRRQNETALLFPLFIRNVELPTYMKIVHYNDCRTNDEAKIVKAAAQLVSDLAERHLKQRHSSL